MYFFLLQHRVSAILTALYPFCLRILIHVLANQLIFPMLLLLVPVIVTPSIFCIGIYGDQLAVSSGVQDPTQLKKTLLLAFQVNINLHIWLIKDAVLDFTCSYYDMVLQLLKQLLLCLSSVSQKLQAEVNPAPTSSKQQDVPVVEQSKVKRYALRLYC